MALITSGLCALQREIVENTEVRGPKTPIRDASCCDTPLTAVPCLCLPGPPQVDDLRTDPLGFDADGNRCRALPRPAVAAMWAVQPTWPP